MKATDGFVRSHGNPGAVLNTDRGALEAYKNAKRRHKELDEVKHKVLEVDAIKDELQEIKQLLKKVIEKINT